MIKNELYIKKNNMRSNQQSIVQNQSEYLALYKYLDINGAKMMLSSSDLQFTNATKFNDPFDCHPSLIDFSKFPPEKYKGFSPEKVELFESNRYRRYREEAWICCLSKVFDSLLMWSYYNGHKGVCIGLNREKVANYLNVSHGMMVDNYGYEVQYRDIIQKPDYFRDNKDFFHYQICTKGKAWEHEQEVRLFILKPSPSCMMLLPDQSEKDGSIDWKEVRAFPEIGGECFESIYLGVNIDKKEKGNIIKLAKELNPNIKIYQMEINTNAFKLDATPI